MTDNTSSATFHPLAGVKARFIRMNITKGGTDGIARIYEFVVE